MILLKNTCVDECLVLSVSPFCTLLLLTVKWEQRVGGESDWNSLWSNDCKLWKLRGFSNHSWMCWRVNVGRLRNGGERGCGDSIVGGALSKALQRSNGGIVLALNRYIRCCFTGMTPSDNVFRFNTEHRGRFWNPFLYLLPSVGDICAPVEALLLNPASVMDISLVNGMMTNLKPTVFAIFHDNVQIYKYLFNITIFISHHSS